MERRHFLALALGVAASMRHGMALGANFYSTQFPNAEDPLSENGRWINGKTTGLDWQDIRTMPGIATFSQPNLDSFDDSTAVLAGAWGPNQYVRTVVRIPTIDPVFPQEIEIRLRSALAPHSCTGYEVLGGTQIVRWNGPLGDFTVLNDEGPYAQLRDGDVFEANIVGNVITVLVNNVQVNRAVDSVFTTGSPGMGFFTRNPSPAQFGLSSFMASDTPFGSNRPPAAPTNLNLL